MPPRSLSERSPVSVMGWGGDDSTADFDESTELKKPMSVINGSYNGRMITSCLRTDASGKTKKGGLRSQLRSCNTISFATDDEVFPMEHLNDMSSEEIANIWYDPKEYAEIKSAYQVTLFMMENENKLFSLDDPEHTVRGLEYRTQAGAWARYENKRDAYNAVLDEQDRQWKVDVDDHFELSKVYLLHSTKCAIAAAQRGQEDASMAREICAKLYKKLSRVNSMGTNNNPASSSSSSSSRRKSSSRDGSTSSSSGLVLTSSSSRSNSRLRNSHERSSSSSGSKDHSKQILIPGGTTTDRHVQHKSSSSSSTKHKTSSSSSGSGTSSSSSRSSKTSTAV